MHVHVSSYPVFEPVIHFWQGMEIRDINLLQVWQKKERKKVGRRERAQLVFPVKEKQ